MVFAHTNLMREKPILFSGPMVRAILAGRKTQTRRVVKPQTLALFDTAIHLGEINDFFAQGTASGSDLKYISELCPYGQPYDRLWVKETYSAHGEMGDWGRKYYRADLGDEAKEPHGLHWRPSIFCTRKASRITLEITAVRVERLNDISETDAIAEGATITDAIVRNDAIHASRAWIEAYRQLWESINGAGSWAANPWVWVIEFKADRTKEGT